MIARIIVLDNNIVIYDESVVPLDEMAEKKIEEIIHNVFKDKTLLIISNKFRHAVKADRVMIMEKGKIKEFDTPESLYLNPETYLSKLFHQNTTDPDIEAFKEEMEEMEYPMRDIDIDDGFSTPNSNYSIHLSASVHSNLNSLMNMQMPKSLENVFTNPNTPNISESS